MMKIFFSWLIILMFITNTVSAFPLYEGEGVPAFPAVICSGVDLSSPIAAVNGLTRTESPLQSQIRPSGSSRDNGRSICDVIFTPPGLTTPRGLSISGCTGHGAAVVSFLLAASSYQTKKTMQGETSCTDPGGGLSILSYLVVLARANLPWAFINNGFCPSKPGCFPKAGFFI